MKNNSKPKPEFNKVAALDNFITMSIVPPNAKMSDHFKIIVDSQNYFQKIYDDAFADGFEKGCEASKKIEEL